MRANGQSNSRAYQTSVRYLKRYGLTGDGAEYDFLAYGAMRLDDLPPADERIAKQVQMSMIRFTNESVFMPNPNDTPLTHAKPLAVYDLAAQVFPTNDVPLGWLHCQ